MTEAGIDGSFTRDIYVSLGERLEGDAWSVRIYMKPFIRHIWLGAILIAVGGFLAAGDRRYRLIQNRAAEASGRLSGAITGQ
jgi:cytochrome c-type biogenesis protein CcmF